MPTGGYRYTQPETGMKFNGNEPFKPQCLLILAHRKGNRLARATFAEVAEDVVAETCRRVPGICIETAITATAAVVTSGVATVSTALATPKKKCGSCGGRKAK